MWTGGLHLSVKEEEEGAPDWTDPDQWPEDKKFSYLSGNFTEPQAGCQTGERFMIHELWYQSEFIKLQEVFSISISTNELASVSS